MADEPRIAPRVIIDPKARLAATFGTFSCPHCAGSILVIQQLYAAEEVPDGG
jgi:hypothetical protein